MNPLIINLYSSLLLANEGENNFSQKIRNAMDNLLSAIEKEYGDIIYGEIIKESRDSEEYFRKNREDVSPDIYDSALPLDNLDIPGEFELPNDSVRELRELIEKELRNEDKKTIPNVHSPIILDALNNLKEKVAEKLEKERFFREWQEENNLSALAERNNEQF